MNSPGSGTGSGTVRPHFDGSNASELLTLGEAARIAGVSERALRKRAERGTLATSTAERGGKLVCVVERAELVSMFPHLAQPAVEGPALGPAPVRPVAELASRGVRDDALREQLEALEREHAKLREELAHVRGQLTMSERVELAAQRAADKLEAKADAARREALTLARSLGQAEGERDRYRTQLEAPRGFWGRLLER